MGMWELVRSVLQILRAWLDGNQADTAIEQAWINTDERCNGKRPDKCEWLERNKNKFPKAAVKATQKAWGCRSSRISKDKQR